MKTLEDRINDNVDYWTDQWETGDYNVFKMELDEDETCIDIEHLNWKSLSSYILDMWIERGYLYIELDEMELNDRAEQLWIDWSHDEGELTYSYWHSRGL